MLQAKPRVLVIGGTQFMGRATVAALLQSGGYDVTILNRGRTESPFEGRVRHIVCDRQKKALGAFIASEPAWHAVVDFVAFGPEDVRRIVPHVDKLGLYILISTDSVYMACSTGGFERSPSGRLTERSDAQPDMVRAALDAYGANKRDLEQLLARHCGTLRSLCLRLPDVLGPHENTGRQHKLLKRLVCGKPIGTAVESGGDGGFGRTVPLSVTFADDVAAAVVAAVGAAADAERAAALAGVRLHVCADETPTWSELVTAFAAELRAQGVPVPPPALDEARDTRFVSVDCGALDGGAAARLLPGYAPAPLAQRLHETVAWWLEEQRLECELAQEAEPRVERGPSSSNAKRRRNRAAAGSEAAGEVFRFNFAGSEAEGV